MSDASAPPMVQCAECGTAGSGRFCAECAAPLTDAGCKQCSTRLVPGARYCHHCGVATNARARTPSSPDAAPNASRSSHTLSWVVGVGAFVALAGFVVSQRSTASSGAVGADTPPTASGDAGEGIVRAPDISAMSPRERAERLFDRAMMAKQSGKLDSAAFFASMATMAYSQLGELALDDHYDL